MEPTPLERRLERLRYRRQGLQDRLYKLEAVLRTQTTELKRASERTSLVSQDPAADDANQILDGVEERLTRIDAELKRLEAVFAPPAPTPPAPQAES